MKRFNLRNEILLQLLESAQDGIVVAEKEGDDTILVYVNPAFERLTGYSTDEILYQDCRFLQGEGTDIDAVKVIRHAIDGQAPVRTVLKKTIVKMAQYLESNSVSHPSMMNSIK